MRIVKKKYKKERDYLETGCQTAWRHVADSSS